MSIEKRRRQVNFAQHQNLKKKFRPNPIETGKFSRYGDQDTPSLGNIIDLETETQQD